MPMTLAIRGLCLVTYRTNYYEVALNSADDTHQAVLTILTKYLKPDPTNPDRWDPDRLGYIPVFDKSGVFHKFEQVGIWDLDRLTVLFSNTSKAQDWANRKDTTVAFDHPDLHDTKCQAIKTGSGGPISVVRIDEGTPTAVNKKEFTLRNKKTGNDRKIVGTDEVRFTGVPTTGIQSGGKIIAFNTAKYADIFAAISNEAAEPDPERAREHFMHYYYLLRDDKGNKFSDDDQFHLIDAGDVIYDCVPPGTAP